MSKQLYKCFSIARSETLFSCFCSVAMLINFAKVIFCNAKYRSVMYRVCLHAHGYKCCCQRNEDAQIATHLSCDRGLSSKCLLFHEISLEKQSSIFRGSMLIFNTKHTPNVKKWLFNQHWNFAFYLVKIACESFKIIQLIAGQSIFQNISLRTWVPKTPLFKYNWIEICLRFHETDYITLICWTVKLEPINWIFQ